MKFGEKSAMKMPVLSTQTLNKTVLKLLPKIEDYFAIIRLQ